MWIDIHAHLSDLTADSLNNAVSTARDHNVSFIVNVGTDIASSLKVIEQCKANDIIRGTVGISAFDVVDLPENWESQLAGFLDECGIIGIGETGIDSTNPTYPPLELQMPVFEKQLDLAVKKSLPVIIHSRGAESKAVEMCKNHNVSKALFHCYTGSLNALKQLLDQGYYVSFSGIVTFKNVDIQTLAKYAPLDRLFIETDSPYLAPVPFRGKKNQPAWVSYIGKKVAEIKNISENQLAAAIQSNFNHLFNV